MTVFGKPSDQKQVINKVFGESKVMHVFSVAWGLESLALTLSQSLWELKLQER